MKHLNRLLTLALASLTLACSPAPEEKTCVDASDISVLGQKHHPRLVMDDKDFKDVFKTVRHDIKKGIESPAVLMHRSLMEAADATLAAAPLVYEKDAAGKRILHVSRAALDRIASCAYAYRFSGDARYLAQAQKDMDAVCGFADWNPSHYLDAGEMCTAVAFGYDWLYDALSPESRALAEKTVKSHVFDTREGRWFYGAINNWNQVCNAGVVAGAVAFADIWPEESLSAVNDALASNPASVSAGYSPAGAYREGPGYWSYGTQFQILLNTELEKAFGTDFGLSGIEGFDKTMDYLVFTRGNAGKCFNYSDNPEMNFPEPALWYFAARFGKADMMESEMELLRERKYGPRLLPLFIRYAAAVDARGAKAPATMTYAGEGANPVVMTRTGWGPGDLYLGIKGGRAAENHGHMDAGSFVYDAYGQRWSMDMVRQDYSEIENLLWSCGGEYWSNAQESMRWRLCRINNRFHSTLTVNDMDHVAEGTATLDRVWDEAGKRGATLDMTEIFGDTFSSMKREAVIAEDGYLRVTDTFVPAGREAAVRWSMATPAEPEMAEDGIILRAGGVEMKLSAQGSEDLTYHIWSGNCRDYEGAIAQGEKPYPTPVWVVGYESSVPADKSTTFTATLKKL